MALLFSAVTVTANNQEVEFLVGGIPREFDDLEGWTAFDNFMEDIDEETEVSVHAKAYLYGGEETYKATPEEVAYFMKRITESEVGDFEKYLLTLIPPELFNLYFFDGEKIADFFLEEGSNARIKDAFLTLCGYDTFEIMRKNFKRVFSAGKGSSSALQDYLDAKESYEVEQAKLNSIALELKSCIDSIDNYTAEIELLEKQYHQKGGITEDEWNQKLFILKEEEKKRENYNAILKKWANEIVPFIMIRDKIAELNTQISEENNASKFKNFFEILSTPEIQKKITNSEEIVEIARKKYGEMETPILDLSFEQSAALLSQTNEILAFDTQKVAKLKRAIKRSISISAQTRDELDRSSTTTVQEYMKQKAKLYEEKSLLLVKQVELEKASVDQSEMVEKAKSILSKTQSKLEDELKQQSINDISARAIVMIDNLQKILYQQQIKKVEHLFRSEIKALMRKTHFIDDISIDNDFIVHIYKNETMDLEHLSQLLSANNKDQVISLIGRRAYSLICSKYHKDTYEEIVHAVTSDNCSAGICLPIEIEKTSLSNGEKQIFIMALYHSLIQLCSHEVPFIIDTPFARIDTEHRINISKHFFSKLTGQVFILSTNEEIDSKHVGILKDRIASTFMLENVDNKKTTVESNSYFEV